MPQGVTSRCPGGVRGTRVCAVRIWNLPPFGTGWNMRRNYLAAGLKAGAGVMVNGSTGADILLVGDQSSIAGLLYEFSVPLVSKVRLHSKLIGIISITTLPLSSVGSIFGHQVQGASLSYGTRVNKRSCPQPQIPSTCGTPVFPYRGCCCIRPATQTRRYLRSKVTCITLLIEPLTAVPRFLHYATVPHAISHAFSASAAMLKWRSHHQHWRQ